MSQSSEASCYGSLTSPTQGFLTFQINNVKQSKGTLFPRWTFDLNRMLSFDFGQLYTFNDDHTELTVSNYSYTSGNTTLLSKITVMEIVEAGADQVKMVLKTLTGCEQMYTCSVLHRRTDNILELEQGLPTRVLMATCADSNFRPDGYRHVHTLLLNERLDSEPCDHGGGHMVSGDNGVMGVHNVTSLKLGNQTQLCDERAFNRLEIGCSSEELVQFIKDCSGNDLSLQEKTQTQILSLLRTMRVE